MKYNDRARLDSSQVRSGGGGRGKIAIGGGAGVVVLIVALLLGVDPGQLGLTDDPGSSSTGTPTANAACRSAGDIAKDRECRFVAYTNSIQAYWAGAVRGYREIEVREFTDRISTGCGTASSAVGPFYCPADTTVYLDLGFFDQLTGQLGAEGGDAAEAYVFAHEFGHHVQNLTGTMDKVSSQSTGATSSAVRLELQADCYAGVWFANATKDPNSPIAEVTRDDLDRALDAAAAVGNDRIQRKAQGQVNPESWTHGSAAMRQRWLTTGFTTGDPARCDTFTAKTLD